jgi:hypothetical protein
MVVYTNELDKVARTVEELAMLLVTARADMKVREKYRIFENAFRRAQYLKPAREFIMRWETAGCPAQFEGLNMRHRLAARKELEKRKVEAAK